MMKCYINMFVYLKKNCHTPINELYMNIGDFSGCNEHFLLLWEKKDKFTIELLVICHIFEENTQTQKRQTIRYINWVELLNPVTERDKANYYVLSKIHGFERILMNLHRLGHDLVVEVRVLARERDHGAFAAVVLFVYQMVAGSEGDKVRVVRRRWYWYWSSAADVGMAELVC